MTSKQRKIQRRANTSATEDTALAEYTAGDLRSLGGETICRAIALNPKLTAKTQRTQSFRKEVKNTLMVIDFLVLASLAP